ncbi:hypothetical protein [Vibrio vulnificus]|uniref:hypothetical protein n=1 Tax=Vibrio vulnificus TaxID=672 RepID=UPI0032423F98
MNTKLDNKPQDNTTKRSGGFIKINAADLEKFLVDIKTNKLTISEEELRDMLDKQRKVIIEAINKAQQNL